MMLAKMRPQRPGVVAPVSKRVPAGTRICEWALNDSLATFPARSIIRANRAVVNGAPRSEVNTIGDFGSCPRWSRRRALRNPSVRALAALGSSHHCGPSI